MHPDLMLPSFRLSPEAKTAQGEGPLALDGPRQASEGMQPPSGHPSPATGQGAASKCPFLAAQMSQGGSSVFRRASLELQEDVQEMHAVRKGEQAARAGGTRGHVLVLWTLRFVHEPLLGQHYVNALLLQGQ